MSDTAEFVTYQNYLKIPELLDLQVPLSDPVEHDEMLFIVIHQVYELWFKVVMQELDFCASHFTSGNLPKARAALKRVLTILKVLVGQLDVLETMTPRDFQSFRDRLQSASGFQSAQFRVLEFFLGHKRAKVFESIPEGSAEWKALEQRRDDPTLWDAFLRCLVARGFEVPSEQLERDVRLPAAASEEVQAVLVEVYRTDPQAASLCERLVDLAEGLQEWRYRHVKMVERTIGQKPGTGGSAGVDYLKATLGRPVFPDLWAIRSVL
ncbi:MAG: tryptophan 2,3-dioxygenase [Longimicrobiales bacterium]